MAVEICDVCNGKADKIVSTSYGDVCSKECFRVICQNILGASEDDFMREEDWMTKANAYIGETIKVDYCNGFFGRNFDSYGDEIYRMFEDGNWGDDDEYNRSIVVEVIKENGIRDYANFNGHWATWEQVYKHLKEWTSEVEE